MSAPHIIFRQFAIFAPKIVGFGGSLT